MIRCRLCTRNYVQEGWLYQRVILSPLWFRLAITPHHIGDDGFGLGARFTEGESTALAWPLVDFPFWP